MSDQERLTAVIPDACCVLLAREPVGEAEAAELARVFKALADPVRLRLLSLIASRAGGEVCVCDLTGAFDVTAPTISHHLKVLREAGLITSRRRGTWVYYRLRAPVLERLAGLLTPRTDPPGPREPAVHGSVAAPAGPKAASG